MLEMMVKFRYKSKGWKATIKAFGGWIGGIILWILTAMGIVVVMLLFLYISILIGSSISNPTLNSNEIMGLMNGTDTTESYPICNQKWNANLTVIDLAALSLMVYDVGAMEKQWNVTFQDEVCLYFDGAVPDVHTEEECSWNVVYRHTADPLFVHLRRDLEHRHGDDPVFVVWSDGLCLFVVEAHFEEMSRFSASFSLPQEVDVLTKDFEKICENAKSYGKL